MPPRMCTRSAGRPATESLGGGTGKRVGRGGRGRRPKEGNDERVDELNGQGNDQGMGANEGIEGVNGNGSIAADLKRGTDGNEVRGEVIIYFPRYCLLLSRLAICQNLGNPQFFITFTCNVNWPEIRRYMAQYPQLMTSDQSIYRRRVFLADDSC
ncbi:reverse transcriptase domain-containing protein [Tanacetum coccineum]